MLHVLKVCELTGITQIAQNNKVLALHLKFSVGTNCHFAICQVCEFVHVT